MGAFLALLKWTEAPSHSSWNGGCRVLRGGGDSGSGPNCRIRERKNAVMPYPVSVLHSRRGRSHVCNVYACVLGGRV